MLWFLLLSSFFPYLLWPVELAALHAAAKNIINLTARTDGMYGGALSRSPRLRHLLYVAFCVAPRQSVGRQRP